MTPDTPAARRVVPLIAAAILCLPAFHARADYITDITTVEIAGNYEWGYWCGVKQPLGAYQDGWSIHQLTKSNYPIELLRGNPDHILWVDENTGNHGVSIHPTGTFTGNVQHPGGQVAFGVDGTIWYAYGGRALDLPLDLYMSTSPYDVGNFIVRLDDWETWSSSTTPCLHVDNPQLMLFWRHGYSSGTETTVRFRRYDIGQGFVNYDLQTDIGKGCEDPVYGPIGIEQLYTRYDPRFDYHFVTWQWWDHPGPFGSSPFLYSDDDGDTWRTADGAALTDLPIDYTDRNDILIPYDNIAIGQSSAWNVRDLGVSPNGTFWCALPHGDGVYDNAWSLWFWRFDGVAWDSQELTGGMIGQSKPHALGATEDFLVLVYSDFDEKHILKARYSGDDGVTWSDPEILDILPAGSAISWVSYVQPAHGYDDNTARFFYGYFQWAPCCINKRYRNNHNWISFQVHEGEPAVPGDVNGDGIVDVLDVLEVLAAWGPCPGCAADLNGDGEVTVLDLLEVLAHWTVD